MSSGSDESGATDAGSVRERSISGAKSLGMRTVFSLILRAASVYVTSRLISQDDFGLFFTVSTVAGVGMYFGDVGMTALLVSSQDEPTSEEKATAFWTQQLLTAAVALVFLVSLPLLLHLNGLPASAGGLIVALTLGMFLSSLRIVPMVTLERALRFDVIARAELFENIIQVGSTIGFAILGAGVWSFILSGLAGRAVSLVMVWLASPWRPTWAFDMAYLRRAGERGVHYQMNAIAPVVLKGLAPAVINRTLGVAASGALGWAANLASLPGMLTTVLNRIAFPAYSRLQGNPEEMGRALGTTIRRVTAIISVAMAPVVFVAPVAIPLLLGIAKPEAAHKWDHAIPLFQWTLMEGVLAIAVGLLAQAQSAAGRPLDTLIATLICCPLRLLLLYVGMRLLDLQGIGVANYLATLLEIVVLTIQVRRFLPGCEGVAREAIYPVLALHIILGYACAISEWAPAGPFGIGHAAVGLVVYGILLLGYDRLTPRRPVTTEAQGMIRLLRPRAAGAV